MSQPPPPPDVPPAPDQPPGPDAAPSPDLLPPPPPAPPRDALARDALAPSMGGAYPVGVDLDAPDEVDRWRPLVHWLLAIPHLVVLYALTIASRVLFVLSFFTVLITRKNPFVGFQTMYLRYQWRTGSYVVWMRQEYPPFDFATTPGAERPDRALLVIDDPGPMNRWLVLVKWLLGIPHYIVLIVLAIGAFFAVIIGFFAVLFTKRWPPGLRDYIVGVQRWSNRVFAYEMFLTDEYPPFRLRP